MIFWSPNCYHLITLCVSFICMPATSGAAPSSSKVRAGPNIIILQEVNPFNDCDA